MNQNRWTSPVLWGAIIAQILGILIMTGAIDTGISQAVNGVAAAILELLVLLGVLNNPTDKTNF